MSDALEQAKKYLQDSIEIPLERGQDESIACVQTAQAAALIAIAEQMARQTEHLLYIRSHLTDLSTFFQNAEGAGGALKVTQ